MPAEASRDPWPSLPYEEIRPTVAHLHRLTQIGGKYTLDQPYEFNWGNIVLSVTPRGFSCSLKSFVPPPMDAPLLASTRTLPAGSSPTAS